MNALEVDVAKLRPAKDNPRRNLGDLTELVASVKAVGILEPLVVMKQGRTAGYEVVAGARRLAAAKKARLKKVPCIVREFTEAERAEAMLIENLQRTDLQPLEEAHAFQVLIDTHGYTQRKIAERLGRNQSHVSRRLNLLQLTPKGAQALDAGRITVEDALELTKLKDDPKRADAALSQVRQGYGSIRNQVARQVQERVHAEQLAAATAQAEKDPAPFIPMKKGKHEYSGPELPDGARFLGSGYREIPVKQSDHKKLDCHAVTVEPGDYYGKPKARYICTKPSTHPQPKPTKSLAERRRDEEFKQLQAAGKVRREALRGLLADRVPARDRVLQIAIVEELVRASHQSVLKIACDLLGIEPVRRETKWHSTEVDYAGPLRAFAAGGEAHVLRLGLAVYLAACEESASAAWGGWGRLRPFFALLGEHGYEISDAERNKLEDPDEQDANEDFELAVEGDLATCRVCGCSDEDPCQGGCSWVPDPEIAGDLCSTCLPQVASA